MKQFGCTLIAENEVQLLHHQVEAINLPGIGILYPIPKNPTLAVLPLMPYCSLTCFLQFCMTGYSWLQVYIVYLGYLGYRSTLFTLVTLVTGLHCLPWLPWLQVYIVYLGYRSTLFTLVTGLHCLPWLQVYIVCIVYLGYHGYLLCRTHVVWYQHSILRVCKCYMYQVLVVVFCSFLILLDVFKDTLFFSFLFCVLHVHE